ncbi:protein-L-isoaspartate O-methyltransferase domain-containing protein 1 [Biomphalaria glabrata]|uniref:Protein-L-isoaspartate O-methyltransferase domain-containing protein 1-like n=1 Tax=Biomphalaria glabrata TaxID=6526 RepID=A0A9W3AEW5_BIOGL|nr:protein-L-isoaspartate O-methyltransferase domain-containing protein 1-like [Biomphalaria glabrata]XP_055885712.1 protein-L-isoaspartate O-methyltransferase domain-containing protein 1-like [Biomphalaria glabrata]XP_055885713.1 protein-L-isoaspartate O-methyltransferase domain-containing protein 1-like [Biomphalaria glabrata]XP_055885714.1 protein-L-isoaspartate O-methyltransferase domain-containing protein 1-like [Biomphalaria glabrata]XP_055885715.1 protein-L-isoaspartate O-methyltransfera
MGGAVSSGQDNDELIDNLRESNYIKTPEVEQVFRIVDRAHYYLPECRDNAYKDLAWKSGTLHLSAPCIYSEVMEALELKQGLSFLNLGSGTGYLSTMVGLMIGPYGVNHGVELHSDNVKYAMDKLESFISTCQRFDDIELCEPQFVVGNCLNLAPENRLYDRVYCGAACPPELKNAIQNMIKVTGILVIPVGDQLLKIKRISETEFTSTNVLPVSFASLVQPKPGQADANPVILPEVNPLSLQYMCRIIIRNAIRVTFNFQLPPRKYSKSKKKRRRRTAMLNINEDRYPLDILPTTGALMILEAFDRNDSDIDTSDDDLDVQLQHHTSVLRRSREINLRPEPKLESHEVDSDLSESESLVTSSSATSKMQDFNGNKHVDKLDEEIEPALTENQSEANDVEKNDKKLKNVSDTLKNGSEKNKKRSGDTAYRSNNFTFDSLERISASSSSNRSISQSSDDEVLISKPDVKSQGIHMAAQTGPLTQPRAITTSYSTSADTSETSGFGSLGDDALPVGSHHSNQGSFKDRMDVSSADSENKEIPDDDDPGWMDIDDNEDSHESENKKCLIDMDNGEEKKGIEEEEEINTDDNPSEPDFSAYLKDKVNSLPIPSTLKAFILYYR